MAIWKILGGLQPPPPPSPPASYAYAYWVCAARETPIFSPEFPFRSISFSQITKKSVPDHHHFKFLGGFCRSGDHHFQNFFNFNPFIASHGWLSPNAMRSAAPRVSSRPERQPDASRQFRRLRIFTLKTDQARSGAPHFQAQNGSSSFRSPAFSRSTGSSFRSPGPFCNLPRHIYLPKFGVSTPPPPPPGYRPLGLKVVFRYLRSIRPSIYSIVPVKDSTWQNYKIYKFAYILTLRLVTNSKALYMRYSLQCT